MSPIAELLMLDIERIGKSLQSGMSAVNRPVGTEIWSHIERSNYTLLSDDEIYDLLIDGVTYLITTISKRDDE